MHKQHHAFADIDEDADLAAAVRHVLSTAAFGFFGHTADGLGAEDGAAEEADGRVGDVFACFGAAAFDCFFGEGVVGFGEAD